MCCNPAALNMLGYNLSHQEYLLEEVSTPAYDCAGIPSLMLLTKIDEYDKAVLSDVTAVVQSRATHTVVLVNGYPAARFLFLAGKSNRHPMSQWGS